MTVFINTVIYLFLKTKFMWIYKFNILIEIYTYLNSGRTIEKVNRKGTSGSGRDIQTLIQYTTQRREVDV